MKKISAIRNIPYLTIILLTLICILLLSSKNMIISQASYPEATIVSSAYAVVEGSDSDKEEITFPHTFKHLSPRTHVTVTTHINLNKDDPIYIKTVYSPAKVYLDDDLIYEFGRAENYPSYMKDPATEGYLIGTDGHSGDTELRIEYLSPVTRSSLTVYSPIYGAYKSLFFTLLKLNKWSFFIALLELAAGVLFILTHGRHVVYRRVQLHRCHSQKPYTAVSVCFYRAFLADDSAAVFLQACSWF